MNSSLPKPDRTTVKATEWLGDGPGHRNVPVSWPASCCIFFRRRFSQCNRLQVIVEDKSILKGVPVPLAAHYPEQYPDSLPQTDFSTLNSASSEQTTPAGYLTSSAISGQYGEKNADLCRVPTIDRTNYRRPDCRASAGHLMRSYKPVYGA